MGYQQVAHKQNKLETLSAFIFHTSLLLAIKLLQMQSD